MANSNKWVPPGGQNDPPQPISMRSLEGILPKTPETHAEKRRRQNQDQSMMINHPRSGRLDDGGLEDRNDASQKCPGMPEQRSCCPR